jgi:hypothetical protein
MTPHFAWQCLGYDSVHSNIVSPNRERSGQVVCVIS